MVGFWRISKRLPPPCLDGDSTWKTFPTASLSFPPPFPERRKISPPRVPTRDRLFPLRRGAFRCRVRRRRRNGESNENEIRTFVEGSRWARPVSYFQICFCWSSTRQRFITELYTVGTRHFGRLVRYTAASFSRVFISSDFASPPFPQHAKFVSAHICTTLFLLIYLAPREATRTKSRSISMQ